MRQQAGWTIWTALSVAFLIAVFALLFMRLFPPYMDNLKIQEALEKVADDPRVGAMNRRAIINELDNILYIDFAHEVVDLKEALIVEKKKQNMTISVDYEVVVPLIYNISALLDFQNQVDVPIR